MEKKLTYVLGTDVLLKRARAFYEFKNAVIVIADAVIKDLERYARKNGECQERAKEALKELEYVLDDDEHMKDKIGVYRLMNNEALAFIQTYGENYDECMEYACKQAKSLLDTKDVVLVSNILSTKMVGIHAGIEVQGYTCKKDDTYTDKYTGREEIYLPSDEIDAFYRDGECQSPDDIWLEENQFVLMRNEMNPSQTALGVHQLGRIYKLKYANSRPYDIQPKNVGQQFALEALLRPVSEAPLVILKGPAGTAKTFLALAAGLQRVVNDNEYIRILVSRPNIKFDEDIGYLKGSEEDKIGPLIRPIYDNLEQLTNIKSTPRDKKDGFKMPTSYASDLFSRGTIKAEALAYMRGRSIARTWVIEDEAQNMTPAQAYGIVTRIGEGSKVILCGDPEQVDSPNMTSSSNGLTYVSERMKGSPFCWQITFNESECLRSSLARDALKRMKPKEKEDGKSEEFMG